MHTKTCQNYLWPVLRRTICHIKVPSRSPARSLVGPLARRRQPPALGLSISLLAINNVEHRHDKPLDSEVTLKEGARPGGGRRALTERERDGGKEGGRRGGDRGRDRGRQFGAERGRAFRGTLVTEAASQIFSQAHN